MSDDQESEEQSQARASTPLQVTGDTLGVRMKRSNPWKLIATVAMVPALICAIGLLLSSFGFPRESVWLYESTLDSVFTDLYILFMVPIPLVTMSWALVVALAWKQIRTWSYMRILGASVGPSLLAVLFTWERFAISNVAFQALEQTIPRYGMHLSAVLMSLIPALAGALAIAGLSLSDDDA